MAANTIGNNDADDCSGMMRAMVVNVVTHSSNTNRTARHLKNNLLYTYALICPTPHITLPYIRRASENYIYVSTNIQRLAWHAHSFVAVMARRLRSRRQPACTALHCNAKKMLKKNCTTRARSSHWLHSHLIYAATNRSTISNALYLTLYTLILARECSLKVITIITFKITKEENFATEASRNYCKKKKSLTLFSWKWNDQFL